MGVTEKVTHKLVKAEHVKAEHVWGILLRDYYP